MYLFWIFHHSINSSCIKSCPSFFFLMEYPDELGNSSHYRSKMGFLTFNSHENNVTAASASCKNLISYFFLLLSGWNMSWTLSRDSPAGGSVSRLWLRLIACAEKRKRNWEKQRGFWVVSCASGKLNPVRTDPGTASSDLRRSRTENAPVSADESVKCAVCLRDVQRDIWTLLTSPPELWNKSAHDLTNTHTHTLPKASQPRHDKREKADAGFLTQTHTLIPANMNVSGFPVVSSSNFSFKIRDRIPARHI